MRSLVLASLLASPLAAAAREADAELRTAEPPVFRGAIMVAGDTGAAIVVVRAAVILEGTAGSARVVVTSVEREVVVSPFGEIASEPRVEVHEWAAAEAAFVVEKEKSDDGILVIEGESATLSLDLADIEVALSPRATWHYKSGRASPAAFSGSSPEGWARAAPDAPATVSVEGDLVVNLAEGRIHVGGRSVAIGSSSHEHVVGRTDRYSFAVVELRDAEARLVTEGDEDLVVAMRRPTVDVVGSATFRHATGRVAEVDVRDENVTMTGDVRVTYPPPRDGALAFLPFVVERRYAATGDLDSVLVGARTIFSREPTATVGLAVGLAALLAAARVAFVLYTRLAPDAVLRHRSRERLLRLVRADPGAHARALQRASGFAWGKLHYHLMVL
ncbi:MAG TPA: hypothetical protein VI997_11895, partial [Candidatus Thermoplasmatota archaeon]|nr:hypothetical protein [Candidatus Thermoplasmatota archaeon]